LNSWLYFFNFLNVKTKEVTPYTNPDPKTDHYTNLKPNPNPN